ncbi:hypothetical protein BV22DRAFT_156555 [Leucogyrophana mollusca]|uniref:Uncharacterized protein n=1 Tax=Leucogyrophana mollusca TaxID=85980 RepID=A0ACB8BUK8_9AGAM|nr:hypothetical protein BV22DRAFT_156555 [Leucogyrophana mollusca]
MGVKIENSSSPDGSGVLLLVLFAMCFWAGDYRRLYYSQPFCRIRALAYCPSSSRSARSPGLTQGSYSPLCENNSTPAARPHKAIVNRKLGPSPLRTRFSALG